MDYTLIICDYKHIIHGLYMYIHGYVLFKQLNKRLFKLILRDDIMSDIYFANTRVGCP